MAERYPTLSSLNLTLQCPPASLIVAADSLQRPPSAINLCPVKIADRPRRSQDSNYVMKRMALELRGGGQTMSKAQSHFYPLPLPFTPSPYPFKTRGRGKGKG